MEKELLRWEKAQAEAKLERLEETEDKLDLGDLAEVKTPRRPGENVGKSHYEAVDSEVRFKVPHSMPMCQEETSGYLSQDFTAPKLDDSPLHEPQRMKMSTPFAPKRQDQQQVHQVETLSTHHPLLKRNLSYTSMTPLLGDV